MGLFTLEGTIAIPLLQQMESLIVRGADEKKFDTQTGGKSLFGAGDFESSMEEQYGLNYPGEVLERYEERCGGGIEQERALGLALAENKMLLEESMFVGAQYPNFIRKIKNHTEQDFYLTCVMYLLSEKVEEQGKFYQKILQHDYKETKEVVFAAFVLQEHPKAWDFVKPLFIRFLGNGRTLRAYGNHGLYAWVLQMYADKIQKCRTKDMYVLKALLELRNKFVKEGTPAWEHLKNAGYSRQEIIYLNLILRGAVWSLETPDKKSITIERMALFGLKELINAKEIEDPGLLPFCESLLKDYESYDIHIEGAEGILSSLIGNVHIRDRQMYQYLYGIKQDRRLPEDWFYLDFSDKESCEISKWMEPEQFTKLFSVSLYSQESVNTDLWFDNYQEYTGKRYEELFWKVPDSYVRDVFRLLVKQNKIDMVKLLEEYAKDEKHMPAETLKNKWSIMKGHIGSVARYLTSHEVYLFWEAFDRYYGICQLDGFFGYRNVVLDAVKVQSYGYRFQNMKFKEEILSVEEQAKLFDWVELMVYREMPQEYEKFLYNFLLMYGVRKSFPEDSVSLFHFIKEDVGESERNRLYREYFSTDEWEAFRKKENERREQIKKERRQEELQTFRKQICAEVNHAGTILTAVPLSLSENGYLRLGEEMDFTGGMASIQEYQEKMKSRKLPNEIEKAENAIGRADEFLILGGQADRYAIYQIDETSKAKEYMFMCFEFLTSHGMSVDGADYQYIYGGRLLGQETLESLFERFNLRHPENYGGHSLSISDVVVVQRDKHTEAYYVDSIGYIQLPDFISQRKEYVEKLYKRQDMLVNE